MINKKYIQCNKCGNKFLVVIYDQVHNKYFCNECDKNKPELSDEEIKKAFKKITDKHMKRWF